MLYYGIIWYSIIQYIQLIRYFWEGAESCRDRCRGGEGSQEAGRGGGSQEEGRGGGGSQEEGRGGEGSSGGGSQEEGRGGGGQEGRGGSEGRRQEVQDGQVGRCLSPAAHATSHATCSCDTARATQRMLMCIQCAAWPPSPTPEHPILICSNSKIKFSNQHDDMTC